MKISLILLWLVAFWLSLPLMAQRVDSVYQLRTSREVVLLGAGVATGVVYAVTSSGLQPLSPSTIQALNRQQLAPMNRGATYQWSPQADRLSDLTLLGNAGIVGLITLPSIRQKHWVTLPLMYLETLLVTNGIQRSIKNLTEETRPFVYNPDVPLLEKTTRDARRSFFSGHTTNAFASAVFASTVFSNLYPRSRLKPWVWGSSMALATGTGLLRYKAGQHFPVDLVVGAAFGSIMGWAVPKLHQRRKKDQWTLAPWSNGQANGVYVRYVPVYR